MGAIYIGIITTSALVFTLAILNVINYLRTDKTLPSITLKQIVNQLEQQCTDGDLLELLHLPCVTKVLPNKKIYEFKKRLGADKFSRMSETESLQMQFDESQKYKDIGDELREVLISSM